MSARYSIIGRTGRKLAAAAAIGGTLVFSAPFVPLVAQQSGAAQAQSIDGGGRARMNLAGRLMVLGQTVAAAACMMDAGYNMQHERDVLEEAHEDFTRLLWALEHGDMTLGIPTPEHKSAAVVAIREIHEIWEPMDASAIAMLEGDHPHEHALAIAEANQALLEKTELLASIIINEYADPFEVLLTDALAISLAERQEMFAEKLKREACEIGGGHADPAVIEDFKATIAMFGNTLTALHDGYPAAGIRPPPNDAIKHHLEQAMEEWTAAQPVMQAILDSAGATEAQMTELCKAAEGLDHRMHGVVIEYLLSVPGANDMLTGPLTTYADEVLRAWVTEPVMIDAIRAHNAASAGYDQATMAAMETRWEAELAAGSGPMMEEMETHPASVRLHELQAGTSDIVTEAFIMDLRGLNVAESEPTHEFWHIDQERWKNVIEGTSKGIYISEVHVEKDSETYQAQVSIPISDPDTLQVIGVATFGVNVQSMF